MAIIRGAFGGGQIKGSIAGNTFQQSAFGTVMRNRTVPVNPNSPGQISVRIAMALCSTTWGTSINQEQYAGWLGYAQMTPLPDRFGTTQQVSARSMFMRTNINRVLAGLSIQLDPPATPGIAADTIPTLTISLTTGITLTALSIDPVGGGTFQISLSPPVGFQNKFFKGPFETGVVVTDEADLPLVLKTSSFVSPGQFYFVRYRCSDLDGKVSNSIIQKIGPPTV